MTGIVTRFAPSPTGFLHIGGARTALFNWLYARRHGGKMHLRIEDTDRQRSTKEAIDAILDGLSWLEIGWDGDVVYQFQRAARHREVAEALIAVGRAYRCYATPQELQELRDAARREGRMARYDGRWRDRDPAEAPTDVQPAIRLKARQDGETIVEDLVQGKVVWQNTELDDLVLLRSDGTPTYMLSVVVDDHDMGVTHIIRGDDHLNNAARQSQIYDALGWEIPKMAHISLIHGPDGAKLSKRHGALGVEAYRAMGFLPPALRNYLVRLGWSYGDQEIFSTEQMVELFDFEHVGRSAARFDFAKLENLNGQYLRAMSDADVLAAVEKLLPHLPDGAALAGRIANKRERLLAAMTGLKERAKTLVELIDSANYVLVDRPLDLDEKARELLNPDGRAIVARMVKLLETIEPWTVDATEAALRAYAEREGLKLSTLAQPLRAALTGRGASPGIFEVLAVLGKAESLARLKDQAGVAAAA